MKSLSLNQPHMIIMAGIPGSGKTFFAEKFANTFHAPYVSREKIAALSGADTVSTSALLEYQLDELLKTQQSILVDGTADTRAQRSELSRKAHTHGYETLIIWVQTDQSTAKARFIKADKSHTSDLYDTYMRQFAAPVAIEKPMVISGKHTYATQAKVVLKKLSEPRAAISSHSAPPIRSEEASPRRRNITIR